VSYGERVKALVIGCGRVGSNVALQLAEEGWEVTAVDEKEEALTRLGENWRGGFVLGHGMDVDVLREAGIEDADAVVVATNGDNTNLVVVRVLDPARADFYQTLGLRTISPTKTAISELLDAARACEIPPREPVPTT
jgi:trk system potassium uptake protein